MWDFNFDRVSLIYHTYIILLKVYRTVINSRYIGNEEILCRDSILFKEFAL